MRKIFFLLMGGLLCLPISFHSERGSSQLNGVDKNLLDGVTSNTSSKSDDAKYIGKGYDITSGIPLFDTKNSLKLQKPIFDINKNYLDSVSVIESGASTYEKDSSSSKKKMANSLGKLYSGGLGVNVPIKQVTVDLSTSFDMSETEEWGSVQQETFSYYDMVVSNKSVVLVNPTNSVLSSFLSDEFKKDVLQIKNVDAAKKLLSTYGTHLVTGYSLGGIFEMTNYFASKSASYVKKNQTSFEGQISAGLQFSKDHEAQAGVNFSFSNQYAKEDNTDVSTYKYKLRTFGGQAFAGLTIDQAFTYYTNAIDSGYLYEVWTRSINKGVGLTIVGTPENSMIPLYEVLPETKEYDASRELLLEAYIDKCSDKLAAFNENNRDARLTNLAEYKEKEPQPLAVANGYQRYSSFQEGNTNSIYSYSKINLKNSTATEKEYETIQISNGDRIALDYEVKDPTLAKSNWKFEIENSEDYPNVELLGNRNDIVQIKEREQNGNARFNLVMKLNDTEILRVPFQIVEKTKFSGGDGSEERPYVISRPSELIALSKMANTDDHSFLGKHYSLIRDLDFSECGDFSGIGSKDFPFTGLFDGMQHTIKNLTVKKNEGSTSVGIFNCCSGGTIKNLSLDHVTLKVSLSSKAKNSVGLKDAGLLVGSFCGKIDNCSIQNSTLSINMGDVACDGNADGHEGTENTLCAGLVIGNAGANASIKHLDVSNNHATVKARKVANINFGGAVGLISDGTELDSVGFMDNDLVCINGEKAELSGINKQIDVCFGGFIGLANGSASIKNSTIKIDGFEPKFKFESDINRTFSNQLKCVFNAAFLIGNTKDFEITTDNLIFIPKGTIEKKEGATVYNVSNVNNGSREIKGYTTDDKDSKSKYGFSINQIYYNLDNVKKVFVKGEEFSANGITATYYTDDKNDKGTPLTHFLIDYHNFNKNAAGTYNIYLRYDEKNDSPSLNKIYTVTVIEPEANSIKGKLINTGHKYYSGDEFNKNDLEVTASFNDCSIKTLSLSDIKIENETNQNGDKLVSGQNKIVITYQGLSTYVIVNAEEKIASEISIEQSPNKMTYALNEKSIDLEGLVVRVKYKTDGNYNNALDETIKYDQHTKNDFEAFHTRFHLGNDNVIKISYGDYLMANYQIEVVQNSDSNFSHELEAFIKGVNNISSISNLQEKFTAIQNMINKKKDVIQAALDDGLISSIDEQIDDKSYQKASVELDNQIQEYNALITSINNDFDHSISDSSGFVIGNIESFIGALIKAICALFSRLFGLA